MPIPVIKINGEGEVADVEFAQYFNEFLKRRSEIKPSTLRAGCEEYSELNSQYFKLYETVKEKAGHNLLDELEALSRGIFSIEADNIYLKGLHDGYLLGKLLEKGATLTYRRFKQKEESPGE